MYKLEYFTRLNGSKPAEYWLDGQERKVIAGFLAKFRMIEIEGLNMLNTNVMRPISGQSNLYEIRYSDYRIITYYDSRITTFIMLSGFRKQRMNERREIQRGIRLKDEYLSYPIGGYNE